MTAQLKQMPDETGESCVRVLEKALEEARAGKMKQVIVAWLDDDIDIVVSSSFSRFHEKMGLVEAAKANLAEDHHARYR